MIAPLVWTAYILLPVAGHGWLDGVPLGPIEAAALAFVWWVWAADRRIAGGAVVAGLLVVKVALGLVLVERGLAASYYANDSWAPPLERSLDFRRRDITRVDQSLAFGNDGRPDIPLHFVNELRFNYFAENQPVRDRLAYSVVWSGYVLGGGAGQTFYLNTAEGTRADLSIDSRAMVALDGATDGNAAATLSPGWHAVTVRLAGPYGAGRRIEAGEIVDGVRRPFDDRRVYVGAVGGVRRTLDCIGRWVATIVDAFVLGYLVVLVAGRVRTAWDDRRSGRLLFGAAIVEAVLFALPRAGRLVVLTGGDDWLIYESYARSIVLGDVMLGEATAGHAFYAQVLYPYFLASVHLLTGDAFFGPLFVQRLLLAGVVAGIGSLTATFFGASARWIALLAGGFVVYGTAGRWAGILLTEAVFVPLLVLWLWLLVRAAQEHGASTRTVVLAGIVGGVATLVRATLILTWVVALPVWSAALRARRRRAVALMIVVMVAIVSLATLRNWIVTGGFVPVTSSVGMALYVGNTPPVPVAPAPPARAAWYRRLGVSGETETVVEYAFQQPRAFAANITRKAAYALGFFESSGLDDGTVDGTQTLYVGTWILALVGGIAVWRRRREYDALVLLPVLVALSHFATIVAFYPQVYRDRLLLAMHLPLIPYATLAVEPAVAWCRRHGAWLAPFAGVALIGCIFVPVTPTTAYLTAGGVVAIALLALDTGPPPRLTAQAWWCIAYAVSLVVVFALSPHLGDRADFRRELLFPVVAFAVARLARQQRSGVAIAASLGIALLGSVMLIGWGLRTPQFDGPDFGDISRDVARVVDGEAGARAELTADLADGLRFVPQMLDSARQVVQAAEREIGAIAALCLVGMWVQAMRAAGRRGRGGARLALRGALLLPLVLALAEGMPLEWSGQGYPLLALAVLFGLAGTVAPGAADTPAVAAA
ncbi:MAG: hypothetical protein FJW14_09760 [Acidimicrobiia bacterium]|nr:hypothetical protein [Acidimicrobiia bacterium]